MSVICDACETVLSEGVSKCCGADVWAELRADGNRSICQACGEEISPNRLKAIPWAEYCLSCEELRSRN